MGFDRGCTFCANLCYFDDDFSETEFCCNMNLEKKLLPLGMCMTTLNKDGKEEYVKDCRDFVSGHWQKANRDCGYCKYLTGYEDETSECLQISDGVVSYDLEWKLTRNGITLPTFGCGKFVPVNRPIK